MPLRPSAGPLRRLLGSGLTAALALAALPARAAVDNTAVMNLCMEGFAIAMAAAGKSPPPGMAEYTCQCFLQQVQDGASINQARSTCRSQAATKFRLD